MAAAERGNKCRIVSKHDAPSTRLAHKVRRVLFGGLRRDTRVSGILTGDHQAPVERIFKGLPNVAYAWKVLSSDLTSASDLLPLDLCGALAEGVLDGLGP